MKFNRVLAFSATAVASSVVILGISTTTNASPQQVNKPSFAIISQNTALMTGTFVAAEAPTTGTAQIVAENGQKYLEIDSAFSTTDQAPDLQVLLDTVEQPPASYEPSETGRYINLGGLQSVNGEQRYPIPEFVDASQFKSVVVWCRMANATIGYAPLNAENNASAQ